MNQSAKYIESLYQLANQTNTLLTSKQVEQIDALLEKCITVLSECDKGSFVKLLISFFKFFLHCPYSSTETFYKKYYVIVKEGFLFKTKNPNQERYECLILTLFDIADKYYSSLFEQVLKNSKEMDYMYLLQNVLTTNIKGGLSLKGFLPLLRKYIERDKENCKINEVFIILKDLFQKIITQMEEQFIKNQKPYENSLFKFYLINSFFEQLSNKYETQANAFLKEIYLQFLEKTQQVDKKSIIFIQFLALNSRKTIARQIIGQRIIQNSKGENKSIQKRTYVLDILSAFVTIGGINQYFNNQKSSFLMQNLFLLRNNYRSLSSKHNFWQNSNLSFKDYLLFNKNALLQEFLIELLINLKLHTSFLQSQKASPLSVIKTLTSISSPFYDAFKLYQSTQSKALQNKFCEQLLKSQLFTLRCKVYLSLLYFSLFLSGINEYSKIILLQSHLFRYFRKLSQKDNTKQSIKKQIFEQLYLFMNFKTNKKEYITTTIHHKKSEDDILSEILDFHQNSESSLMVQEIKIDEFIDSKLQKFRQQNYTFQNLIDLITILFRNDQNSSFKEQANSEVQFSQLSTVLFDKINIKPKIIQTNGKEISFNLQKNKKKSIFCNQLLRKLYQCDSIIRLNAFFTKNVPQNEVYGQKLVIIALKKYFAIYYSRINELVIRKWIFNREYLKIWSLFLCNYKVKTVAQQLLKCGINILQLKCFFKLQQVIIKDFLEYLITKDKLKFRLALFNSSLMHRKQLIDYSLPDIIF